jgi:hypothetical protein
MAMASRILVERPRQSRCRLVIRLLLFTVLQSVLTTAAANAQNEMSQEMLALTPDERNTAFMRLFDTSRHKCDRVIRTLFKGTAFGLDEWEAMCEDRNAYSFSVTSGQMAGIEVVSCRELLATRKMLLQRAGSRIKATRCEIR